MAETPKDAKAPKPASPVKTIKTPTPSPPPKKEVIEKQGGQTAPNKAPAPPVSTSLPKAPPPKAAPASEKE
jgi:hypothetical protein